MQQLPLRRIKTQLLHLVGLMHLCDSCGSQGKQRLALLTTLVD